MNEIEVLRKLKEWKTELKINQKIPRLNYRRVKKIGKKTNENIKKNLPYHIQFKENEQKWKFHIKCQNNCNRRDNRRSDKRMANKVDEKETVQEVKTCEMYNENKWKWEIG